MLDALADGGLSRASLVQIHSTLGQALRFAVKRGDLSRIVQVAGPAVVEDEADVVSGHQLRCVVDAKVPLVRGDVTLPG